MLNDVRTPPAEPSDANGVSATPVKNGVAPLPDAAHVPRNPLVKPHAHEKPHIDPTEPGIHPARVMGERTKIDPIYAMPMEDRGSAFSLGLSAVVVGVFAVLLLIVWFSFFFHNG